MNTRDLDAMEFKRDPMQGNLVKSGGKWAPYGRGLAWCRFMGRFRTYGEWTVQETSVSSACRGTVRARINGPRGTAEAWNSREKVEALSKTERGTGGFGSTGTGIEGEK